MGLSVVIQDIGQVIPYQSEFRVISGSNDDFTNRSGVGMAVPEGCSGLTPALCML